MKSSTRVALARPQIILWLAGLLLATDALMALLSTTQPSHPCVASATHTNSFVVDGDTGNATACDNPASDFSGSSDED